LYDDGHGNDVIQCILKRSYTIDKASEA